MSTFFRDAVTDHRFAILGAIVHDESDGTAAISMISKTEVCIARISPASSRNSHGRSLLSLPRSPRCFVESKPLLYKRRVQSSHQKLVQLCVWKRHRQRTTSSMAFHGSCEHHQLDCAEPVPHRPAAIIARLTMDSSDHLCALRPVRC